ncbi:RNA-binding S4 domain-containing protein [Nocardioides sp. CFH 31398]|uniref:RNA-binding S4 domain-containing protein n=1 Tax=Nocardioides sp. CFH 31398 TaxID=2919579 RepID=UPI001F064462|nr:RNA-binding S4 domain-containing protein [Nocardioides sp. CFH 31398]MCH1866593.1 RNA-binding S4 domain-containing protein [Nocardioides sp. CFH 31398]
MPGQEPVEVPVSGSIRLGQFLKLADLVDSGAEAKAAVAEGLVTVNGHPEIQRGRLLAVGDVVSLDDRSAVVAASPE